MAVSDKMISKFYGSRAWRMLRTEKLNLNSLCQTCLIDTPSKIVEARQVHHSINLRSTLGWEQRFDLKLLFSLCDSCHQSIESEIYHEGLAAARAREDEELRRLGG